MKVGDYLECIHWEGENYTTGMQYPISIATSGPFKDAFIIINNVGKERSALSLVARGICRLIETEHQQMAEPMFDLDDMELAEILMEEMK